MPKKDEAEFCLHWIKKIKEANDEAVTPDRVEALKFYRADKGIVNYAQNRSTATTTDVQDAVEWAKPELVEIFMSGRSLVAIQGAGGEDVAEVKKLDKLINYQLRIKNDWFVIVNDLIHDLLTLKIGVIKYQWLAESKEITKVFKELTEEELVAKQINPNITKIEEREDGEVECTYSIRDARPLIEVIPPEDVGFPCNVKDIDSAPFFYHRIGLYRWQIKQKWGDSLASKIEKKYKGVKDEVDGSESDSVKEERGKDLLTADFIFNEDDETYNVYECYYNDTEDGTPKLKTICGDIVLSDEVNRYGRPPFRIATALKLSHRLIGLSFYDLLFNQQKQRTALLRQLFNRIYDANNPRYLGDSSRFKQAGWNAWLNNRHPNAFIDVKGDPRSVVAPEEKAPLPPEVFRFWELLNVEKDYHSGIPRAYQGVQPNVLNKTWRGASQQVAQASKRVALIARTIAEVAIAPLVKDLIDLNLKFADKEVAFRYLNEDIRLSLDNVVGQYDCIVTVGLGARDNDKTILQMQQFLGIAAKMYSAGIQIITSEDAYHALKEIVEAMDRPNYQDFCTDPKLIEKVKVLLDAVMSTGIPQQNPQLAALVNELALGFGIVKAGNVVPPNQDTNEPAEPMPDRLTPEGGDYYG